MDVYWLNVERMGKNIRKCDTPFMRWLYLHLSERDGHYYRDEGWQKVSKLIDVMIENVCQESDCEKCRELVD